MVRFAMEGQIKFFSALLLISIFSYGEAYWCTRTMSEQIVQTITELQKCNQTYEAACAFYSWDKCTFTDLVDCTVKKNITVTRYFLVEECCPGFALDPVNNVTCIASSDTALKSVVTVVGADKALSPVESGTESVLNNISPTQSSVDDSQVTDTAHRVSVEESDNLLFGLSHGAYAGIICSLLFLFCIFILIMVHVMKRSKKVKSKAKSGNMEMETSQKMLNPPA